jgi:hypothetical protein
MSGFPVRSWLRWLPVGLGLTVLVGFVAVRMVQRTIQRSPSPGFRQPMSSPLMEGKAADSANRPADLLNRLGVAMSLRDVQTAERLAEELSRSGDDVLPALSRLLLWLDPIPQEAIFTVVLKYFRARPMAMATILEISKTQWIGIGPQPRRLRILIGRGILLNSKELEPALDLNSLLGSRFDQTARLDGRLGLTLLAVHLKADAWEKFVRAILPKLKDQVALEELLETIAEIFGRQSAPVLLSLLFDPDCADARIDITRILQPLLPPEAALAILLSATKPDAGAIDQPALAAAVSKIVETVPHGMDLIRQAWKDLKGPSPKCGILMGLGDLKTRQDVGEFLLGIARSSDNPDVRGTALLSASRQSLNHAEVFGLAAQHLATKSEKEQRGGEVYTLKVFAIWSLSNLAGDGSFAAETRAILRDLLLKESDPWVVRDCLKSLTASKMVELRETVQKLSLEASDNEVKAAAAEYLKLVR